MARHGIEGRLDYGCGTGSTNRATSSGAPSGGSGLSSFAGVRGWLPQLLPRVRRCPDQARLVARRGGAASARSAFAPGFSPPELAGRLRGSPRSGAKVEARYSTRRSRRVGNSVNASRKAASTACILGARTTRPFASCRKNSGIDDPAASRTSRRLLTLGSLGGFVSLPRMLEKKDELTPAFAAHWRSDFTRGD